jgi:DedD protein
MSSDSPSQAIDQELQFKKRARRRLVGAIALVLVMIAVLPMVLDDHEHTSPQQAVTITIPSQNAEFTTQAPLKAPEPKPEPEPAPVEAPVQSPVQEAPRPPAPSPVIEAPVAHESPKSEVSVASNIAEKKAAKKATDDKKIEAKKPEQAKKPDTKSTDKTPEKVQEKSSTADKPHQDSTDSKTAEDSGKPYYLQIGVFSDTVNVSLLQKKLTELKLKPYTERISTDKGEKTRLKVGPFDNKQQADNAAEKVKTIGLSGFVSNK